MSLPCKPTFLILDCDGVLIDSEFLAARANQKAMNECGLPFTFDDTLRLFLGKSLTAMREILVRDYHVEGEALEHLMALKDRYVNEIFARELKPLPGVPEALEKLKAMGVPFGVASNSRGWRLRSSLEITGLLPFFGDNIWGVESVAHGKPAPDLYLFAARELGAEPSQCLVIDDSPTGVTAAVAAHIPVVGFTGANHLGPVQEENLRAAGALTLISEFARVPEFFR